MATTASAKRAFSSPLVVQITKAGTADVAEPAITVTNMGRLVTLMAIANMAAKIPKQQSSAASLGNRTISEVPNHVPWSNIPSHRPTTSTATHAGLE
jgi:hypothetical protein